MAARSFITVAKTSRDPSIPPAGSSAGSSPRRLAEARQLPTDSADEAKRKELLPRSQLSKMITIGSQEPLLSEIDPPVVQRSSRGTLPGSDRMVSHSYRA